MPALRYLQVVLTVFLMGSAGLAAPPEETRRIASLVTQLGDSQYARREAAMQALEKEGEAALPSLRQATGSHDPEVQRRAGRLTRRIEARVQTERVLAPQLVELSYDATPVAIALADLGRKTGMNLHLLPGPMRTGNRRITLQTGKVPFWVALERFCTEAGLVDVTPPPQASQNEGDDTGVVIRSMVVIRGNAGPTETDITRTAREEKKRVVTLVEGEAGPEPTCYVGSLRLRLASLGTSVPDQVVRAGELLMALEVDADPRITWRRPLGVRITEALGADGVDLLPLPVLFGKPRAAVEAQGRIVINGVPIDPTATRGDEESVRVVPIRLRPASKSPDMLKNLTGIITAEIEMPSETVVAVPGVLEAAGRTVKGPHGGSIRMVEVRPLAEGHLSVKVVVERIPRGLDLAMPLPITTTVIINGRAVGGEANLLDAENFALLDARGTAFRVVKAIGTGRTEGLAAEYELEYQPEKGQGRAESFVYRDRRTVILDVPFAFKNVPLK